MKYTKGQYLVAIYVGSSYLIFTNMDSDTEINGIGYNMSNGSYQGDCSCSMHHSHREATLQEIAWYHSGESGKSIISFKDFKYEEYEIY